MHAFDSINELVQLGRGKKLCEELQAALAAGISAEEIIQKGLIPAMYELGIKFKNNEVYVPEVMVAARAMNMGMALLNPLMTEAGIPATGIVVIGTVRGDMHDIGKNLVKMMMQGRGLNVIDLGVDVRTDRFVEAAEANHADIICCSALLTTTMHEIKNILRLLEERGVRDKYRVMIGGNPVSQRFCDAIGADYYTPDAVTAADVALEICKNLRNAT